jgi:hypothetical protein
VDRTFFLACQSAEQRSHMEHRISVVRQSRSESSVDVTDRQHDVILIAFEPKVFVHTISLRITQIALIESIEQVHDLYAVSTFLESKSCSRLTASMGSMRRSNFHVSALSCSKVGRWWVSPSTGMDAEDAEFVTCRSFFASSGSCLADMSVAVRVR